MPEIYAWTCEDSTAELMTGQEPPSIVAFNNMPLIAAQLSVAQKMAPHALVIAQTTGTRVALRKYVSQEVLIDDIRSAHQHTPGEVILRDRKNCPHCYPKGGS